MMIFEIMAKSRYYNSTNSALFSASGNYIKFIPFSIIIVIIASIIYPPLGFYLLPAFLVGSVMLVILVVAFSVFNQLAFD